MFRPLGRGLRDTLDNLLAMTIASLAWWACLLLIVTAPAGTLALFSVTDPRRMSDHLRPTRDELIGLVRGELLRAWVLAVAFGIPVLVLANNLRAYAGDDGTVRWLTPIWLMLLLVFVAAAGIACSLRAVHGRSPGLAIRGGLMIALAHGHRILPIVVVLWVIVAIGGLLVIPALMFVPGLVAVTMNHVTYEVLGITVDDALDPTDERRAEQERSAGSKYSVN